MKKLLVTLFVLCMMFTAKAQAANLIANGSFEEGPAGGASGFNTYYKNSTAITGWKVTSGSVDHISTYWTSADGSRSIDLSGNDKGAISQSFNTLVNRIYKVKFSFSANPVLKPYEKYLSVSAADKNKDFNFNTEGKSVNNMGWVEQEFTFKANSENTTLTFASLTSGPCGTAIDNVRVEEAPVPEPSTMFLGFLGASGLLKIRRRKKN